MDETQKRRLARALLIEKQSRTLNQMLEGMTGTSDAEEQRRFIDSLKPKKVRKAKRKKAQTKE